ncbi:MAG: hypothetical protein MHPSP_004408, partial [Paramarteilia canceri]
KETDFLGFSSILIQRKNLSFFIWKIHSSSLGKLIMILSVRLTILKYLMRMGIH